MARRNQTIDHLYQQSPARDDGINALDSYFQECCDRHGGDCNLTDNCRGLWDKKISDTSAKHYLRPTEISMFLELFKSISSRG